MCATFYHPALVKYIDHIRLLDCTETMRHSDGGASARGRVQGRLHHFFGFRVQGGGGFVEKKDFRVAQKGACDGYTLFLAAGEKCAFRADNGGEAITERTKLVFLRCLC